MTSISGKTESDRATFAADLAPVRVIEETVLVKKRSHDVYWSSPILNAKLKGCFGDLAARPVSADDMAHCLAVSYAHHAPIVMRGGGQTRDDSHLAVRTPREETKGSLNAAKSKFWVDVKDKASEQIMAMEHA